MKLLIFDQAMTEQVYSGRKTMHRIRMEPQPSVASNYLYGVVEDGIYLDDRRRVHKFPYKTTFPLREWWRKTEYGFEYKTDGIDPDGKWMNPNNLLLKAARVWLDITEIYIERFSEISGTEFDAEGMKPPRQIAVPSYWNYERKMYSAKTKQESIQSYYRSKIPNLDMNDWAWVIHFQHATSL